MAKVLIADPDPESLETLKEVLASAGHVAVPCPVATDVHAALAGGDFDLVIADADQQGGGLDLLRAAQSEHKETAVILTTLFGSVDDAVTAMRAGAADLLRKPFSREQAKVAMERALEHAHLVRENDDLRRALDDRAQIDNLIGDDPRMQSIFKTVRAVADTRTTVLVTGESGTGKTVVARALHALSARRNGPFVEVNCGALPETLLESELFGHVRGSFTGATRDKPGKFEAAQGGTIFLDEIGTSSPAFQIRLLRVLQDRLLERVGDNKTIEVDCRIVLATNLDLEQAVADGRFREDLYYRINVVAIEMPPLRQRRADIPALAQHFLRRFAQEHGRPAQRFTAAALGMLQAAPWPGNVRQLENVIERAVIFGHGPTLDGADLPPALVEHAQRSAPTFTALAADEPMTLRAASKFISISNPLRITPPTTVDHCRRCPHSHQSPPNTDDPWPQTPKP